MIKALKKKRIQVGKGYGENLYRNLDTARNEIIRSDMILSL